MLHRGRILATGVLMLSAGFQSAALAQAPAKAPDCGALGQPGCSVSPAEFRGKKPAGCPRGSFFDPIDDGTCWICPPAYIRHGTHVKAADACLRLPWMSHAKATRHKKGTGIAGISCEANQFWDPLGYCYSCPAGYIRTGSPVTAGDACAKPIGATTTRARFAKSLACAPGSFPDMVDGGTCWSCPYRYVRTGAHVKAPNACAVDLVAGVHRFLGRCSAGLVNINGTCARQGACGAKGQRPCLLTERLPSCDKGLAEDFVQNRCVEDQLGRAACMALVDSIWAGKEIVGVLNQLPSLEKVRADTFKRLGLEDPNKVNELKKNAELEVTKALQTRFPELARITYWMNDPANLDTLQELFSAKAVCSNDMPSLDTALIRLNLVPKELLAPKTVDLSWLGISNAHAHWLGSEDPNDRHLYMGYLVGIGGAKWAGLTLGLIGITDFRGNGGRYFFLGPQLVTNISGGIEGRVLFTSANMPMFEGWGFAGGVTVPYKTQYTNIGIDAILDSNLILRGAGLGGGAGAGAYQLPIEGAISATHSWKLN